MRKKQASNPSSPDPLSLTYTTPDRLVRDFASRGLVVLAPESLGIPSDVHNRVYAQEKGLMMPAPVWRRTAFQLCLICSTRPG